jgi:hypothetical protein
MNHNVDVYGFFISISNMSSCCSVHTIDLLPINISFTIFFSKRIFIFSFF